jgi:hypothetical protein
VNHIGDTERYVCIVPYAGMPDDICGHWSPTLELLTQHMQQQHHGVMIEEGATAEATEGADDIPAPTVPGARPPPGVDENVDQGVAAEDHHDGG